MSSQFTDAQLAAFLEGRLDDDALIDAIEAAINADVTLAERMERLDVVDHAGQVVRDSFAPLLRAPVPDHLVQIVNAPAAETAEVIDFTAARAAADASRPANDNGRGWRWPQFGAMAASLALGVMVGGAWLTGSGDTDGALVLAGRDGFTTTPAISAMLDTAPSGQSVDLTGLGTGEVVLTFRNSDRKLCRQFTIANANTTSDALACAKGDSGWQIEALGRRAGPTGDMQLASGDAAVSVVAAVDAMIDGDPLVGEAEAAELKAK